ncbi:MAG TPA: hypothetical protein VFB80_19710 [Pirellulaceae bacterium]|nr:hypothetical protein [Pirellulaceae bacterium]
MTIEQVRKLHQARPFQPFRMHLADSRSLDVVHPELLAISEPGRTVIVVTGDESLYEVVDLLLVTSLEVLNGRAKAGRRKH